MISLCVNNKSHQFYLPNVLRFQSNCLEQAVSSQVSRMTLENSSLAKSFSV